MNSEFLYGMSEWLILLLILLLLASVTELSFRFGLKHRTNVDETARVQTGIIQAAILGLLGLMLGFTFSMAANRFDARKGLVLEESNALGTAELRARLLPDEEQKSSRKNIRKYVDLRVQATEKAATINALKELDRESRKIHDELWADAVSASKKDTRSVSTGLFVESLNDVIDLHDKRYIAYENHVPEIILTLLISVAMIAMGLTGYSCGLGGRRVSISTVAFGLMIATVIMVIIDLDRPQRGLITVSQKSMIRLQENLNSSP